MIEFDNNDIKYYFVIEIQQSYNLINRYIKIVNIEIII